MAYTNINDPSAYFQTALYTGTGSTQSITNDGNSNLQPDLVWIKHRSGTEDNLLFDSTRGAEQALKSNSDGAEFNYNASMTAFNSDGFSVGTANGVNGSGTFVGWQWKVNGGTTSSNTSGNATSTVQVNTTAGVSIVTFTGRGLDGTTVGHGLGEVPAMVIFKCRDTSNTDWRVYHQSIAPTLGVSLNSGTAGSYGATAIYTGTFTSTLLRLENDSGGVNRSSSPMLALCFAEKQGFSKFGKYISNGQTTGPMTYTGFKPAFIVIKDTTGGSGGTGNWVIWDAKRNPYNPKLVILNANAAGSEFDATAYSNININVLSNGFRIAHDSGKSFLNMPNRNYIFMAFAENPFVTSTGIPATAK